MRPGDDDARMQILFTSSPGVGHLMPLLSVARAAEARGHDVRVGCGASMAQMIERAGLRHELMGLATIQEARAEIPGVDAASGRQQAVLMMREAFARILAGPMAEATFALAATWRPDVLVHEDLELGAWLAAERLGFPHATIQATAWRPNKRLVVVDHQNRLRERFGLEPDPELAGRHGSLFFTTRPRAMRDPTVAMPSGLRELRPEPDDRVGGELDELPDWLTDASDRPRIAVTLGTVNAHRIDLLRPIVDGLSTLDVDVVVGLGADPETLGPVPKNVRVERYVAMSQLLPRVAAVVHHAGSGTTLAALAAGRPMAVLPIAADQAENAAAAVAAGVAISLDPSTIRPEEVADAVTALIGSPAYAASAQVVADQIRAMPDAAAAVAELEALA